MGAFDEALLHRRQLLGTDAFGPPQLVTDRGRSLRSFLIVAIVLEILFPLLRLWSRLVVFHRRGDPKARRFWWDDYFCFLSVPFAVACYALLIKMINLGIGQHVEVVGLTGVSLLIKMSVAFYPIFLGALLFPKISALFFYARVLRSSYFAAFNIVLWAVGVLAAIACFICAFLMFFRCDPIEAQWYWWKGTCKWTISLPLYTSVVQLILDLIVLILPLPRLWHLQLPLKKKLLMIGLFVVAYSVFATTIGRMVALLNNQHNYTTDFTYAVLAIFAWDSAWPLLAMFSICLPSIFSLFRRWTIGGYRSLFSSKEVESFVSKSSQPSNSSQSTNARPIFPGSPTEKYDPTVDHSPAARLWGSEKSNKNLDFYDADAAKDPLSTNWPQVHNSYLVNASPTETTPGDLPSPLQAGRRGDPRQMNRYPIQPFETIPEGDQTV